MRWLITGLCLALAAAGLGVWLSGGDRVLALWALDGQREAQSALAGALRQLRAGDIWAIGGLLGISFTYGFFHAVGPGHGKILIGGYGIARRVQARRLASVALAASLAQAVTAIALVGAGLWIWGLSRERMTDLAEDTFAPLSFAAISVVGLWLFWRGLRGLWRQVGGPAHGSGHHEHDHHGHDHHHHGHDHDYEHDHEHSGPGVVCDTCGHAHAPDPRAVVNASGLRELVGLVLAIAIRPCTGALFLLILTAQLQAFWAGVLGAIAMALGTATVTIAVAFGSVGLRAGVLAGIAEHPIAARVHPILEVVVGALIAAIAARLALAVL